MKKILISTILTVFLIGCSSSDDSTSSSVEFNPPNWIQGTWGEYFQENDPTSGYLGGYKFTIDNIFELHGDPNNPNISINYKEHFNNTNITEEFYANKYVLKYSITSNGTTLNYSMYFFKINNTTFKYGDDDDINGSTITYHKL